MAFSRGDANALNTPWTPFLSEVDGDANARPVARPLPIAEDAEAERTLACVGEAGELDDDVRGGRRPATCLGDDVRGVDWQRGDGLVRDRAAAQAEQLGDWIGHQVVGLGVPVHLTLHRHARTQASKSTNARASCSTAADILFFILLF